MGGGDNQEQHLRDDRIIFMVFKVQLKFSYHQAFYSENTPKPVW